MKKVIIAGVALFLSASPAENPERLEPDEAIYTSLYDRMLEISGRVESEELRARLRELGKKKIRVLFHCKDPCIISDNMGGVIEQFQRAAIAVRAGARTLIVVDGECPSSCAWFADLVRPKACITRRASFAFHKFREPQEWVVNGVSQVIPTNFTDPPHSSDIDSWVKKGGGYPRDGYLFMSYEEAKDFFEANIRKNAKLYKELHALIVEHAKETCRKKPDCGRCQLKDCRRIMEQ